jgi:polysaccharide export outer membrane protein
MIKSIFMAIFLAVLLQSCASKKDILYFQDAANYPSIPLEYGGTMIQPNDILSIGVTALVPETAIPYNLQTMGNNANNLNIEILKLQGYLVSPQGAITFPVLGTISVLKLSISELEQHLKTLLEQGGHLVNPSVSIRLLNAKVTVLGEVNKPGTFTFTEQYITVPQALGYAGDLTINGKRNDILLIRETEGVRTISHLDLTTANWMNDSKYVVKQNDVLVINPNNPKIKTAGYIGNTGTLLTVFSLVLSSLILLTR